MTVVQHLQLNYNKIRKEKSSYETKNSLLEFTEYSYSINENYKEQKEDKNEKAEKERVVVSIGSVIKRRRIINKKKQSHIYQSMICKC